MCFVSFVRFTSCTFYFLVKSFYMLIMFLLNCRVSEMLVFSEGLVRFYKIIILITSRH